MNESPNPRSPTEGMLDSSRTPIAVRRVGAHVNDVNGYTDCQLTVLPGEVRLRLGGPLVRVTSRGMYGKTLVQTGPDITLARVRRSFPWLKAALLLPSTEHRALVPLSRRVADALVEDLQQAGFRVSEVEVRYFGAAISLLTDLSWKQVGSRRRKARPPSS
jgi:hypothetical protein